MISVIDEYLKDVDPAMRVELNRIRAIAIGMMPGAEEVISYKMPTLKYKGKSIIGFDAHKNHIGIYPYSGSVIKEIEELKSYDCSKSAIREKLDNLLPQELIMKIIKVRLKNEFN